MSETDDFASTRARWLAGKCPCCGAALDWWTSSPEPVAEGVMFCGRCIENHHHTTPGFLALLLESLVANGNGKAHG